MIRRNPERLAWSVLILSFAACVSLAIGVPLATQSFLIYANHPATLILGRQQGTPLLQRPNTTDFVGVTDQPTEVPEGSVIHIDESTQAVLTMRDPDVETNLIIVQLYGNTELTLQAANTPRFDISPNPHRLDLFVKGGRMRVNVLDDTGRPAAVSVRSPQGDVAFTTGTYAVEVSNEELQVTVREGRATVSAQGTSVVIDPSQRARVKLGQPPEGGLSGERNLITNGSFDGPLEPVWSVEHDLQFESEAKGTISPAIVAGQRAAQFEREGRSHAETSLVQEIQRDVTDAASLQLHFAVLIDGQTVSLCGSYGSECPLMVRINYRDTSGTEREWLQGFYSVPDPNNPPLCLACPPPRNTHSLIPRSTWFTYDSDNLMEVLPEPKPSRVTRITFYASGHSYRSAITDVELLVQD